MAGIGIDLAMVAGMGEKWGLLMVMTLDSKIDSGLGYNKGCQIHTGLRERRVP